MGVHQWIRAADVLVLGPFSIWFGVRATQMPTAARVAMVAYGGTTIAYNAWRFALQQRGALPPG
jgi:hypothetical protein